MSAPAAVLLVDDQALVAEAVRRALEGMEGISFHACSRSEEALTEALRLRPALILQDLVMPGTDGLGLLELYRADPTLREVPVIVLSTREEAKVKARAFELGANDYLVKLPDRVELRARVRFHTRAHLNQLRREEADRALRAALRLREDFAHMVIHDLGTPLGAILLDADDLLAGTAAEAQQPAMARIRNNALRLAAMSQDMLLLAKMEDGKLRPDAIPRDLLTTVREALQNLEPQLRRRRLEVRESHAANPLPARYDGQLLLRVMDNLLSNAIKFSTPGGVIEVRTGPAEGGRARVEVEDRGPGIPDALRERIFEKFEVGAVRRDLPQVGLGLAFCRMAVEAHGGRIGVASGAAGGGVLWFEL